MDPSIHEAVSAAFEKAETPEPVSAPEPVAATPEPAPEPVKAPASEEGRARDEHGRFAPKTTKTEPPPKAVATSTEAPKASVPQLTDAPKPATETATEAPKTAATSDTLKPPVGWKALLREQWGSLPPETQRAFADREKEVASTLSRAGEALKQSQAFKEALAPFEQHIRASGLETATAARNLFQFEYNLRNSPPAHKAQLVAQMVKTYGVPIEDLDAALSGQAPTSTSRAAPEYRDPRVDSLLAELEQTKAARQREALAQAQQQIAAFAESHEFFEDVRQDMADMREVAAKRGIDLSIEDAYARAIALHPEIQQVVKQREAAKAVQASQETMQRARAASSSVRSQPAAAHKAAQPKDLREAVAAAFETHSGRI